MRRQPPVHSPLPGGALLGAAVSGFGAGDAAHARLRQLLVREYGADAAVVCGSGTQALELAIRAALARRGADAAIALPAFTCFDVAAAAVAVGNPILLFDVDPHTLGPEPESVERVLNAGAGIVVVSPLYGIPVAWEPLARLAAGHGAVLVEDAAQGHGATWRGRPLGSLGALSVLSFGRGKGWTGGRGGAVLFRGEHAQDDAKRCERFLAGAAGRAATLAAVSAQWLLGRPWAYAIPAAIPWLGLGETRYRDARPPAAMVPAAARLLLRSRAAAIREAAVRRETARFFGERSGEHPRLGTVRVEAGGEAGFLRFPVRVPGGLRGLADPGAARRCGIAASYPSTLAVLGPVLERLSRPERSLPGAERLAAELVTLPTHSLLSAADRERVVRALGSG